jgi:hypothetical protein
VAGLTVERLSDAYDAFYRRLLDSRTPARNGNC